MMVGPVLTIESDQRVMEKGYQSSTSLTNTRCSYTGQDIPALDKAFDLIEGHPMQWPIQIQERFRAFVGRRIFYEKNVRLRPSRPGGDSATISRT